MEDPPEESIVDLPLRYFEQLFTTNYIGVWKEHFLPNPNDEHDSRNQFPIKINNELSYDIDYPTYITHLDEKEQTCYEEQNGWRSVTVNFQKEFEDTLKSEFYKSKLIIDQILKNSPSEERAKYVIRYWLGRLCWYLRDSINGNNSEYAGCERPVRSLIRYLYTPRYSFLCPKANTLVKSIIAERSAQQKKFETPSLSRLFFAELVKLEDHIGPIIEGITDNNQTERLNYSNQLFNFYNGDYNSSLTVINFTWGKEPVYYTFSKLRNYGSQINLRKLEASGKVKINGERFSATLCDKNASVQRHKFTPQREFIDFLFDKHVR